MAKIPVFLVEDHHIVREGIRRLLELDKEIAVVGEADSAEEALKQVEFSSPQVVFMDIRLPGMDGIEATRQLKARYPEMRVVILSGFGHEYLAQAIEAGADGYLLKTTSQEGLVDAVKQAAGGQTPIDSELATRLFGEFAELYKRSQPAGMTRRQLTILQRVSKGIPSKEIAVELNISDATFKRDMRGIFDYLGVNDRAQAIAEAYNRKLL